MAGTAINKLIGYGIGKLCNFIAICLNFLYEERKGIYRMVGKNIEIEEIYFKIHSNNFLDIYPKCFH